MFGIRGKELKAFGHLIAGRIGVSQILQLLSNISHFSSCLNLAPFPGYRVSSIHLDTTLAFNPLYSLAPSFLLITPVDSFLSRPYWSHSFCWPSALLYVHTVPCLPCFPPLVSFSQSFSNKQHLFLPTLFPT